MKLLAVAPVSLTILSINLTLVSHIFIKGVVTIGGPPKWIPQNGHPKKGWDSTGIPVSPTDIKITSVAVITSIMPSE